MDVLRLVAQGHSNAQIADTLFISVPTVKRHLTNILGKLESALPLRAQHLRPYARARLILAARTNRASTT